MPAYAVVRPSKTEGWWDIILGDDEGGEAILATFDGPAPTQGELWDIMEMALEDIWTDQ